MSSIRQAKNKLEKMIRRRREISAGAIAEKAGVSVETVVYISRSRL